MKRALAPGYDLFKGVVTLLLAAILFILLLRECGPTPGRQSASPWPAQPTVTETLQPAASATPPPTATVSPQPLATSSALPTATASPLPLPTAQAAPTATPADAPTPTPQLPPTATRALQPPAATPQAAASNPDCPGAAISRIKIGDRARVLTNLNLRRAPGLSGAWILTHLTGTELEVIGGPGCTPIGQQAYQWWQVRRPDGREGWSAEASLRGQFYFLEPIP